MNSRLQQFLSAENISQSQFADTIGVARASVSHILAGRNKPGFDFIESMARHYPSLNLEWLITGKGKMYGSSRSYSDEPAAAVSVPATPVTDSLFSDEISQPETVDSAEMPKVVNVPKAPKTESIALDNTIKQPIKERHISKIVVFYDDNTFEEVK